MDESATDPVVRAEALFARGVSCAPAVLAAFAPGLGLDAETAARLASTFGGGIAGTGNACGAITGALMAIGLARGPGTAPDAARKADATAEAKALLAAFTARHGSIACRDLLGVDLGTPEGRARAAEAGLFRTVCPGLVRSAASLLREARAAERRG
jgi:C_GCAxxG_C_C family probable redox protein